jgi:serum/glucocorticoid-regulated kinase 2
MEVNGLTFIKEIMKGSFSIVYLTSKQGTSTKYATKIYNKSNYFNELQAMKYINEESSILKEVNHPNIVKFIEKYEDETYIYILLEFCNGGDLSYCLSKYLKENNKPFSEEIVQYIMRQIIEAVKYLHNKKIIHRQIYLNNIMINYENEEDMKNNDIMKGKIKIGDFVISRYLQKGDLAKSFVGIPSILRPIMTHHIDDENGYDEKIDIWYIGCSCYELLTGKMPFRTIVHGVREGDYYVPITLSKEAISFLNSTLQYDSKKRLSIHKLYNHKFLRKNVKEFNKINLDELKNINIIDNSKIVVNIKNNEIIRDYFGDGI